MKKYRIRSIKWPAMIIEDGFLSIEAAELWADFNYRRDSIWDGGWKIEEY